MSIAHKRPLLWWLFSTAFLVWAMIMLGGATRLTHAGLSIVEWKPITGIVPPLSQADWIIEFAKYQASPEFIQRHSWMNLSDFQFIFFMEYFHRLLGRLMGLFFLAPLVFFWAKGWLNTSLKKRSFLILALGGLQGFMGWYMVKSGLVKDPFVSHYRLTAHLVLAVVILTVILSTAFRIMRPQTTNHPALFRAGHLALILAFVTLVYGGFVAGLKAGLIYNTYPFMGDRLIPEDFAFLTPFYYNFVANPAAVQFIHRWLAALTLLSVFFLVWQGLREKPSHFRKTVLVTGGIAVLQVGLGIMTLLWQVPVALGTLHQGMAILLFSHLFWICYLSRERGHASTEFN